MIEGIKDREMRISKCQPDLCHMVVFEGHHELSSNYYAASGFHTLRHRDAGRGRKFGEDVTRGGCDRRNTEGEALLTLAGRGRRGILNGPAPRR
jgi:hypothetical protein